MKWSNPDSWIEIGLLEFVNILIYGTCIEYAIMHNTYMIDKIMRNDSYHKYLLYFYAYTSKFIVYINNGDEINFKHRWITN